MWPCINPLGLRIIAEMSNVPEKKPTVGHKKCKTRNPIAMMQFPGVRLLPHGHMGWEGVSSAAPPQSISTSDPVVAA